MAIFDSVEFEDIKVAKRQACDRDEFVARNRAKLAVLIDCEDLDDPDAGPPEEDESIPKLPRRDRFLSDADGAEEGSRGREPGGGVRV